MKNNYPIKYASMPIYEEGRNERNDSPKAYIVSKCYLLDEHKIYNNNNDIDIIYEVVFPFQRGKTNYWKKAKPKYDYNFHEWINSSIVNNVYNNKKEAIINTNKKNEDIITKELANIPIDDMWIDKAKVKEKELKQSFKHYYKLEHRIEDKTCDLLNLIDDDPIPKEDKFFKSQDKKEFRNEVRFQPIYFSHYNCPNIDESKLKPVPMCGMVVQESITGTNERTLTIIDKYGDEYVKTFKYEIKEYK